MKCTRISLVLVGSLAVVGVAGWLFVGWSISRALQPPMKEGGGLRRLAGVLEASAGNTLARGDVRLPPGKPTAEGALAFYRNNPQALQRDRKFFETWRSALAIADGSQKANHRLGRWESSAVAKWIAPLQRADAWGHAFCVQSDQRQTIVVSPGPEALSSLDCDTLKISAEELAQIPQGRLNPHVSGALILFVKSP